MEDVVKELLELIQDRFNADKEIMIDYAKVLNDECSDNTLSWEKYHKLYHRYVDVIDLISSYNDFKDKLEKVKNNIKYDKLIKID